MSNQLEVGMKTSQSEVKKQNEEKSHSFIAGLCDVYIYSIALAAIEATISTIIGRPLYSDITRVIIPIVRFLLILIGVIVYYKVFSKKTTRLSLGERICSRVLIEGKKVWINPYSVNRMGLFFIIVSTLIVYGNDWDKSASGIVLAMPEVLAKLTKIILIVYGMILMGKGKLYGVLIILSFNILGMVTAIINSTDELANLYLKFNGITLAIYVIIIVYYYMAQRKS